jgi:hypothetical protein
MMGTKLLLSIALGALAFLLSGCLMDDQIYPSRALEYYSGTIQLSWAPSSGNPQGYYVEQSTDGTDFLQIQNVTFPAATIIATPGTYFFRIRSYNEAGPSGYSSVVAATVNQ